MLLRGSKKGTERGLGSPECAGCLLTFLECKAPPLSVPASSRPVGTAASSQIVPAAPTLHPTSAPLPSPPSTQHQEGARRLGTPGEAGASPGSRGDAGREGCSRRTLGGKDAQRSRGQAEHPAAGRPP